ncbi:Ger(x)C family spore germination protein [Sporosarcina sp.]|uniref:Ger(x)C family spore germination protein n=1 Tax=Sporosarcina sp. TaxID=49982 RepID=UPI00261BC17E|nr:Ger(x)C family spore germination protein [Sporosarcina sp.]
MRSHSIFIIKIVLVFFLMTGVLLQTGCAFKDIDKTLFVVAIAIDPVENNEERYKVTLKVSLPFGAIKEAEKPSYAYLSNEGDSIGECIRMLETYADKVLEFGQMKTILVHELLMTDHLKDFMDYFMRRGDVQLIAFVAGASPSAEEIIKVEPETEAPASVSLFNFFGGTGTESPFITTTYLFQFRRDFFSDGINPVLPLIETNEEQTELRINNAIVIDQHKEPIKLDNQETKYYNSLVKGASGFSYKEIKGDFQLLLNISRIKMDYQIIAENDEPQSIEMNVKMVGTIGESNQPLSLKKLDEYNQMASNTTEKIISKFLKKMQEHEVDPFGFGLRYRATRLERDGQIDKWNRAYPDLDVHVNVDVKLQGAGTIE